MRHATKAGWIRSSVNSVINKGYLHDVGSILLHKRSTTKMERRFSSARVRRRHQNVSGNVCYRLRSLRRGGDSSKWEQIPAQLEECLGANRTGAWPLRKTRGLACVFLLATHRQLSNHRRRPTILYLVAHRCLPAFGEVRSVLVGHDINRYIGDQIHYGCRSWRLTHACVDCA